MNPVFQLMNGLHRLQKTSVIQAVNAMLVYEAESKRFYF